ncbi:MAG TPA: class I SAM-dependent methyltransferase, partial [Jatrophihabitantaceae bacterium]|nr:class I SAM-dependent methyltransferase [Jatrophihabitantaceae bacterium]
RRAATTTGVMRAAAVYPLETYRVRAAIARHGIALWRKGLPVQPRPHAEIGMTSADRLAVLLRRVAGVELPVRLRTWDGSEAGPAAGPVLDITSRRALRRVLWAPGELGLARAYVSGDVEVDGDLTDGMRAVWRMANASGASAVRLTTAGRLRAAGLAARLGALGPPPAAPTCEARLRGRLHTRARDRAAIAHHYDLSNEFYELLLDETMAYSSAYFATSDVALADAQRAKLDLVCTKLGLRGGMRLLDVGCGWGSLTLHAAERYGAHVTGVTLSEQQRDHVAKQVAERGLADRVTVCLQDYREFATTRELFDAVASIEMGEHVGEAHYPVYAGILHGALRPSGRLLLQQMSRNVDAAPGGGAFIESYIAPDMHMRPLPQTLAHLERAGFEIRDVQAMREHYVRTVRHWMDTLERHWPEFVELVGVEVARVWRLYLAGGALSFEQGRMGVDQILAARR